MPMGRSKARKDSNNAGEGLASPTLPRANCVPSSAFLSAEQNPAFSPSLSIPEDSPGDCQPPPDSLSPSSRLGPTCIANTCRKSKWIGKRVCAFYSPGPPDWANITYDIHVILERSQF